MTKPIPKSEQTNEEYLRSLNTEQLAEINEVENVEDAANKKPRETG